MLAFPMAQHRVRVWGGTTERERKGMRRLARSGVSARVSVVSRLAPVVR